MVWFREENYGTCRIKLCCNPISTEDYIKGINKKIAKRPAYSSLDNMMLRCTVGDEMRNWEEELETFMENIKNKGE